MVLSPRLAPLGEPSNAAFDETSADDAAALEAYVLRYTGLVEDLRGFARKHAAIYVRASSSEPHEPVVRRFVARAID